jgi:opacity protein-like surface antigen
VQKASAAALAALSIIALDLPLAHAADMPMVPPPPLVVWSWSGLFVGGHLGAGLGWAQIADPVGADIFGGQVRSPAAVAGFQVGYNWQIPGTAFVAGAEADVSAMSADGSATCLASSPFFFSANCRLRPDFMGSMTGRIGYAAGPHGRTLFYAKGGVAWLDDRLDIASNGFVPMKVVSFDGLRWGWTAGAGVERALTPAWSLRLEYDYAKFGDLGLATPISLTQPLPPLALYDRVAGGNTTISQNMQTVKIGLNYKIGEDMYARWEPPAADYHLRGAYVPDAEIEVGGRVWYSTGHFQKDLGGTFQQATRNLLVSRLTYDTTGTTGEVFGRIDTPSNIFVKGLVGGGKILSGNMHDEDWLFDDGIPYSNTLSTVKGDLSYATFDAGYSLFRGPSAKVGGFVGFNYYRENKSAYGCAQIANPNSDCVPALANSILGITEDDKWYSVRVGASGVVTIWDQLKLTADAAYLPYVAFRGTDNHLLRTDAPNTLSPESGSGQGMQLEAILSYAFANGFNVGAGGRYWAMWAPNAITNIFSTPCPCQTLPVRTERYGAFVQASYKLDWLK